MIMEITITIIIVACASFFLINSMKKKSQGKCDCGSCSSHCPKYPEQQHK